jgi:elongation of very long chain fatty acids protein 7
MKPTTIILIYFLSHFQVARGVYVYFLAKISELLDTVFFVIRKKERQITFLHMYHHTVMPMISWGATKYYPGGHGTLIGVINSFVHIIMYTYYMLAAMGPQYQKFLFWKRHITTLQMVSFDIYKQIWHNLLHIARRGRK